MANARSSRRMKKLAANLRAQRRPCYYGGTYVCDDCSGQPAECARLIAQDQADNDEL